jgi:hypothetical protein
MPDEPKSGVKKQSEEKTVTSNEDFIAKSPLYVLINVDHFEPPQAISFDCETAGCGKGTTWFRAYEPLPLGKGETTRWNEVVDYHLLSVSYRCGKCAKSSLSVVYKEVKWEKQPIKSRGGIGIPRDILAAPPPTSADVLIRVMKVGQYPEPSVALPKGLEKNLGAEAARVYRKALVCRNSGYGMGATVYMRRVVEDKTNELIEVTAKLAESRGIDAQTVAKIRAAGSSVQFTPYEDKLKIASTVFPDSLKVGSVNPFQLLYKLVSEAVHSLTEEECIEIADETAAVFDYVFTNLKAQTDDRNAFIAKVKKLS